MGRVADNKEYEWKCGRCGFVVDYQEDPPATCPNCEYVHGQRLYKDVPDELRWNLIRK